MSVRNLWTPMLSNILWRTGALFAVSLALLVSGVTVLVLTCLLMLADLTDNWRGDALGQILLSRAEVGQTIHGPKLSDVRFGNRHQSIRSPDRRAND
jgi:hypothetical protein